MRLARIFFVLGYVSLFGSRCLESASLQTINEKQDPCLVGKQVWSGKWGEEYEMKKEAWQIAGLLSELWFVWLYDYYDFPEAWNPQYLQG